MYFFTPPTKRTIKPVVEGVYPTTTTTTTTTTTSSNTTSPPINLSGNSGILPFSGSINSSLDKIPAPRFIPSHDHPIEDEKYLYNTSYFSKEEIKLLYELFHRIDIDLYGFTENIIYQILSYLVHLPNGVETLSELFYAEGVLFKNHLMDSKYHLLTRSNVSSISNSTIHNLNQQYTTTATTTNNNTPIITGINTTTPISTPIVRGRNNSLIENSPFSQKILDSSPTIDGAKDNSSAGGSERESSDNSSVSSKSNMKHLIAETIFLDPDSTLPTAIASAIASTSTDIQPPPTTTTTTTTTSTSSSPLSHTVTIDNQQQQDETGTSPPPKSIDDLIKNDSKKREILKNQEEENQKILASVDILNVPASSTTNKPNTTTSTSIPKIIPPYLISALQPSPHDIDEVDEEKAETQRIYKGQFSLIKSYNLWSGKTLKDPEFEFIDNSSEILKYRMIIKYLIENLFIFIRKKYNLAANKSPSTLHIIETISIITRGTIKEKSELVFGICKKKSENILYKTELLELVQSINSLTVLNAFGFGNLGSPEEIVNNIFRDGTSNVNSIQRTPRSSTDSFVHQKSIADQINFKDTFIDCRDFVKRAPSNPDIARCFGFFDLVYFCFVKPIEDYLKSSIKNQQCSGYLYYEKYIGIIKAFSLRWFEVRSGFLIAYKRLFSKPSKVICLFKTNVKVIPKEHPKHHKRLKHIFKSANIKNIDNCKDATDFALRRYDDTEQTFISMSTQKAAAFVNAIRENSKGSYRYHSFATPEDNIHAEAFINGHDYFRKVYKEIKKAKLEIYIAGWWISPSVSLHRKGKKSKNPEKYRLDNLLMKKASEGVKIYILIWDETMIAMDLGSRGVKSIFEKLHRRNIKVIRHPQLLPLYWSHHQKVVVVDQNIAFLGGLDLCFGRYDDINYRVKDNLELNFPGPDYINTTIVKPVNNLKDCLVDRNTQPRMPWHDVSVSLNGKAARDVTYNFIQRWNHAKDANRDYKNYPYLLTSIEPPPIPLGTCKVQIVRSVCGWSAGQVLENSIYKAYLNLINLSQHFIYIQNQFFISSVGFTQPNNQVAFAIYKRIEKAILLNQNFRVYIMLPVQCEGDFYEVDTQLIIKYTERSIQGIKNEIIKKFPQVDIDQYLVINSLRNWDDNGDIIFTEQVYVHSKLMIVDDKVAIIGSANINDRSLSGSRDSEICSIIEDKFLVDSKMNGSHYRAASFAYNLRMDLWKHHLNLILYPNQEIQNQIEDPVIDSTFNDIWKQYSQSNTKIYKEIFNNFIPENCTKVSQYQRSGRVKTTPEVLNQLNQIKGFLIDYPMLMLSEEDTPSTVFSDIITSMKLFL